MFRLPLQNCFSNLTERAQIRIVSEGGLDVLAPLLEDDDLKLVESAVAAVRNLSIWQDNEREMVEVPIYNHFLVKKC